MRRYYSLLTCFIFTILSNYVWCQAPYFPSGAPSIGVSPSPPWAPGTTVTFTITIDNYESAPNNISEWFHGLGIIPGSCWTNLVYGPPPPAYTNGVWMVDLSPLPPKSGGPAIPGFYFDGTSGSTSGFIDGITSNNWGDGSGSGPWTFTWTATVPNSLPSPCDLSMCVRVFGDGETGSWTQLPPSTQPNICFVNIITEFCVGQPVTLPFSAGTPDPTHTYQWDLQGANYISGDLNSYGPITVSFPTPGTPFVRRLDFDMLGGLFNIDTFFVTVLPNPQPSFVISRPAICQGDTATFTYTGNTDPSFTYDWNFIGGTVLSGSGTGPFTVVFNLNFNDSVILVVSNSACADSVEVPFIVKQLPPSQFSVSGNYCTTDTLTVTYNGIPQPGMSFEWDFGNGIVLSGTNEGPYQVTWLNPAQDSIKLKVLWNGCADSSVQYFNIETKPVVDAGINYEKCENTPCIPLVTASLITGGPNCTYQWFPAAGLDDPTSLNPCASPSVTTTYYLIATCGACPSLADSMTIYVNPAPVAAILPDTLWMCEGSSITLPGNASSGTGSLAVQWSPTTGLSNPFTASPQANPTTSTLYYMVVTDSKGCVSDTDSVFLAVVPKPIVDAGQDIVLCAGQGGVPLNPTITNALPGETFTYTWSPAAGLSDSTSPNPIASPSQTTTYTLIVTSHLTGCSSENTTLDSLATVVVTVLPELIADAGPDRVICSGSATMLGGIPTGGTQGFQYLWTPATGLSDPSVRNPIASPTSTTQYTLTVIGGNCTSEPDSVLVTVIQQPTETALTDINLCPGDSTQLFPNIDALGLPYNVLWQPGDIFSDSTALNPFIKPTITSPVQLWAGVDTCRFLIKTFIANVVDTPQVDAFVNGVKEILICEGETVNLTGVINGNFDSFQWTPATDIADPTALVTTAAPKEGIVYYFEVFNDGCLNRDSVFIQVLPSLNASINFDSLSLCQGEVVQLIGSGGLGSATFSWWENNQVIGSGQTLSINPMTNTTYILEVKEGPCTAYDTLDVTVFLQSTAVIVASTNIGCEDLTVSFMNNSQQATSHAWDFGDGNISNDPNPVHTYTEPGLYNVQLISYGTGGCADTAYFQILVTPKAEASFVTIPDYQTTVPIYLPNATVQFIDSSLNAVKWYWEFGDGSFSTEQNPVHNYLLPGEYTVMLIVEDDGGCRDTLSVQPLIVEEPTYTAPNIFTPNGDGINDVFRFDYKGKESFTFTVYDRNGMLLFTTQKPDEGWSGKTASGAEAVEGVYYYLLQIGDKKITGYVTLLR